MSLNLIAALTLALILALGLAARRVMQRKLNCYNGFRGVVRRADGTVVAKL